MKHSYHRLISLCLLLVAATFCARAQVTLGVEGFVTSFRSLPDYGKGAMLTVGYQSRFSCITVKGGLCDGWEDYPEQPQEVAPEDVSDVLGQKVVTYMGCVQWLCRMVSNSSHSLNLYLGAGGFGGVNDRQDGRSACAGLYPALQGEVFVIRRLSFTLEGSYMFELADPAMKNFPTLSVGLKVLL